MFELIILYKLFHLCICEQNIKICKLGLLIGAPVQAHSPNQKAVHVERLPVLGSVLEMLRCSKRISNGPTHLVLLRLKLSDQTDRLVWRAPAGRPIPTNLRGPTHPWTKFGPSLHWLGQRVHPPLATRALPPAAEKAHPTTRATLPETLTPHVQRHPRQGHCMRSRPP
jgi:hypothetical protein